MNSERLPTASDSEVARFRFVVSLSDLLREADMIDRRVSFILVFRADSFEVILPSMISPYDLLLL